MKILTRHDSEDIITLLLSGGVVVLRTDTLYGLLCLADNQTAVERVYACKGRDDNKSPIVLVATDKQLFDAPSDATKTLLSEMWPGKVSVIMASANAPKWIERGNGSVAYRLPDDEWLRRMLTQTGPLIAPSANPQGHMPARTINQAILYFGDKVDAYVDGGEVSDDTPSALVRLSADGGVERLR